MGLAKVIVARKAQTAKLAKKMRSEYMLQKAEKKECGLCEDLSVGHGRGYQEQILRR